MHRTKTALFMGGGLLIAALALLLVLSGGNNNQVDAHTPPGELPSLRPTRNVALSGDVAFSSVNIPAGVTVLIEDDVVISSREDIVIDGSILGVEKARQAENSNGANITLRSEGSVRIRGSLRAGNGVDGEARLGASGVLGTPGGDGGSLIIEATQLIYEGRCWPAVAVTAGRPPEVAMAAQLR